MPTPDQQTLDRLTTKRAALKRAATNLLERRQAAGIEELTGADEVKFRAMTRDLNEMDEHITEYRSELARVGELPAALRGLSISGRRMHPKAASMLSPIAMGEEQLRAAYDKARRGESAQLEMRAPGFSSADSLLPPELFAIPTFPRHEARLLDRLPGYALDAPSLEYVQVTSVTGAAGIVGEGAVKPEVVMPATKLICTALKLAVHGGISWENISDYDAFTAAVRQELMRQVIDLENAELYGGDPTAGGLNSLTKTAGILTLAATGGASTPVNHWDDIAGAIALLRTGPALASPDLMLIHPDSWAAVRVEKDTLGRYIGGNDPTDNQPETAWGVDVMQSTAFTPGEAVLLDTGLVGRVAVREAITVRLGYSGTDFVQNIVRTVVEERLNFAIERPAAICHVTALPTAAPTATKSKR